MSRPATSFVRLLALLVVLGGAGGVLWAALTPEQRKEVAEIRKELIKVTPLISKKQYEEADEKLKEVETRLLDYVKDQQIADNDPLIKALQKQLETTRANLLRVSGIGGISFVNDVVPILINSCLKCHDAAKPSGGLQLDTFAGLQKGGKNGALLVVGKPQQSVIMQRLLNQNPQLRMPKDGQLTEAECTTIATWITQGARFDGADVKSLLADLKVKERETAAPKKAVVDDKYKPTGKETVSFIKDIAPTFVNTCGGCHSDAQKRGDYTMATFEKIMKGGKSGVVVLPGDLDGSRMFQLLSGAAQPVMPAGNMTGISKKFYNDVQTWIKEGAKYDGPDASKPLRSQIPSEDEKLREALAALTPAEWVAKRRKDSLELWEKTYPKEKPAIQEAGAEFLVLGDLPAERLRQIENWAIDAGSMMRTAFKVKREETLFKGKLAIFAFKDRFGYEEFNQSVHQREVPKEILGHSEATSSGDKAYIAIQDVGDEDAAELPMTRLVVMEHVIGAYIKQVAGNSPQWLINGGGLAFAARASSPPSPIFLNSLKGKVPAILRDAKMKDPKELFEDGKFAPSDLPAISYSVCDYLIRSKGGDVKFVQFILHFEKDEKLDDALRTTYGADAKGVALGYAGSLGRK